MFKFFNSTFVHIRILSCPDIWAFLPKTCAYKTMTYNLLTDPGAKIVLSERIPLRSNFNRNGFSFSMRFGIPDILTGEKGNSQQ